MGKGAHYFSEYLRLVSALKSREPTGACDFTSRPQTNAVSSFLDSLSLSLSLSLCLSLSLSHTHTHTHTHTHAHTHTHSYTYT